MKIRNLQSLLLVGFLAMVLGSGCTIAKLYATSGNKISMTETDPAGGESFKIEHRIMFDYTMAVDVQELLRDEYGSGNEFQNVSVKLKTTPADFFTDLFTLGLSKSKTFEIRGDRIRR